MPNHTRTYKHPGHPISIKGAHVDVLHGSTQALLRITATQALLNHIEVAHHLKRAYSLERQT